MINIQAILDEHQVVIASLQQEIPKLEEVIQVIISSLKKGGTVFWMGNGGSAADAQHMAAEMVGRFRKERKALASIALTTDTSILTSVSNDYHFDVIFSRQLEALCKPHDVVIALSTSGNSGNVVKGVETAKAIGAYTIAFTGAKGGKLKTLVDVCFALASDNTPRIQEATALLCHILCEKVDLAFDK
jgi:D-sedoheptulose 7-phosphate isomerase